MWCRKFENMFEQILWQVLEKRIMEYVESIDTAPIPHTKEAKEGLYQTIADELSGANLRSPELQGFLDWYFEDSTEAQYDIMNAYREQVIGE